MVKSGALLGAVLLLLVEAAAGGELSRQEGCPRCLVELLAMLNGTFQVLPGVNISASGGRRTVDPAANYTSALGDFLKSVTLHVAVYNEPVLTVLEGVRSSSQVSESGRSKKKKKRFQFLSVYTVFAVAFALLAGLVGKALTISIISLVITLVVSRAVRNDLNNNSNSPPVYDIVRRPQVQVQHTHSAEEVYEIPTGGGPPNTVSYVYASSPLRGRTSADPYSAFGPNAVHVSAVPDSDIKHQHIAD